MVNFENGFLVEGAYVEINGQKYPVVMPHYTGKTPVSAENLNKMQNDINLEINNIKENWSEINQENLKVVQRKAGNGTYTGSSYIMFGLEDIETEKVQGLVTFEKNALITFNCNALVRISCKVWIESSTGGARPWIKLMDYDTQKSLVDDIDDNSSKYVCLGINEYYVEVTEGQRLGLLLASNESVTLNSASGAQNSYIKIEIL